MGEQNEGIGSSGIQEVGIGSVVAKSGGGAGRLVAGVVHLKRKSTKTPAPTDS